MGLPTIFGEDNPFTADNLESDYPGIRSSHVEAATRWGRSDLSHIGFVLLEGLHDCTETSLEDPHLTITAANAHVGVCQTFDLPANGFLSVFLHIHRYHDLTRLVELSYQPALIAAVEFFTVGGVPTYVQRSRIDQSGDSSVRACVLVYLSSKLRIDETNLILSPYSSSTVRMRTNPSSHAVRISPVCLFRLTPQMYPPAFVYSCLASYERRSYSLTRPFAQNARSTTVLDSGRSTKRRCSAFSAVLD